MASFIDASFGNHNLLPYYSSICGRCHMAIKTNCDKYYFYSNSYCNLFSAKKSSLGEFHQAGTGLGTKNTLDASKCSHFGHYQISFRPIYHTRTILLFCGRIIFHAHCLVDGFFQSKSEFTSDGHFRTHVFCNSTERPFPSKHASLDRFFLICKWLGSFFSHAFLVAYAYRIDFGVFNWHHPPDHHVELLVIGYKR